MRVVVARVWERMPLRAMEWLLSCMILTIGMVMLLDPILFYRANMDGFTRIMPSYFWSMLAVTVGGGRVAALVVNGHRRMVTAPARAIGALLGTALFAGFASALSISGAVLGTAVFCVLIVGDFYNTIRSGRDALDSVLMAR